MFRVMAAAAALFIGVSSANALSFVCFGTSQSFAKSSERQQSKAENDPVDHIEVSVWDDDGGNAHMTIGHIAKSGRVFDRSEQYADNRVERTLHGFRWRGTYDRDPSISMIGTIRLDKEDVYYTETRYKDGNAMWQVTSKCYPRGE